MFKSKYAVILLLIIFSLAFLYKLTQVGPEYDEALFVNAALGCPNKNMFLHSFINLGDNNCLPIMVMPYLGATQAYLIRPVFSLFGVSVLSLRLTNYFFALISLLLTYLGIKNLFNKKVALYTLFLLAIDPLLILTARYDRTVIATILIKSLIVFLLPIIGAAKDNHKKSMVFIFGLLLGLIIYTKLDNVFLLVSLLIPLAFLNRQPIINSYQKVVKLSLFFCGGFMAGLSPFIYYLVSNFNDFILALGPTSKVDNAILSKILYTLTQFSANQMFKVVFRVNNPTILSLALSVVYFLLFVASAVFVYKKYQKLQILSLSFVVFYLTIFFYPPFGAWGKAHHYLLVYPIPQLLISLFWIKASKNKAFSLAIPIIVILNSIMALIPFYALSQKTCGAQNFSCEINRVAEFAMQNNVKEIIVGDWGLATQLLLLTKNKIAINEAIFKINSETKEEADSLLREMKKDCPMFILFPYEKSILLEGRNRIERSLESDQNYNKTIILNNLQKPIYQMYTCKND